MNLRIKPENTPFYLKLVTALALILILGGCGAKKKGVEGLYPKYSGPQVAVEPLTARLGITTLLKTSIKIAGMGFDPGDSVFIDIMGGKGKDTVSIPLGVHHLNSEGEFFLQLNDDVKLYGILKLERDPKDDKPIIVGDTVPPGAYVIKAEGVRSGKKAECVIQFETPKRIDRIKDWLRTKLGSYKKVN